VDSGVSNVFVGGTREREAGKSSLAPLPVHRRFLRPAFSRANSPRTRDERGGRARHVYSRRRAADTHAACKIAAAGKRKERRKRPRDESGQFHTYTGIRVSSGSLSRDRAVTSTFVGKSGILRLYPPVSGIGFTVIVAVLRGWQYEKRKDRVKPR
jgi:hypothetical protein